MIRALVIAGAAALALAGCTASSTPHEQPTSTVVTGTQTIVTTQTALPGASFTPVPATNVPSRPASGAIPQGERRGTCPYIEAGLDVEPTSKANVANLEGNRVGLVTLLPGLTPIGCRFWFAYDNHPVADIQPYTFASAVDARNAMIKTAEAGSDVRSYPGFVKGVDGINYRTKFYGHDKGKDWAFVFAKGSVMVVVHTDQDRGDAPLNGMYVAQAIVGKF